MAFPPLENSDHVAALVSIDFPSYSQWGAPFHRIAYDYYCIDWDGLHDHLRDAPWEDIFKLSASAPAGEFRERVKLEIKHIFLIVGIRWSLAPLHGFQLLVLLP